MVHYVMECLQLLALRKAATIEVTQRALRRVRRRDRRDHGRHRLVPYPAAHTYYRSGGGRIVTASPYRLVDFWRNIAHPQKTTSSWDDPMPGKLCGKTALVTGSSRGTRAGGRAAIGSRGCHLGGDGALLRASESTRAGAGATLPGTIGETIELILAAGGRAFGVAADLEDPRQRDGLIDEVLDRAGRIDILVNNAGFADYSVVEDMSLDTFDRTVEHYLRTPFVLTKAAVPHMRKQGAGWIVNIGSVTGVAPVRPYREYNKVAGDVVYAS